MFSLHYPSDRVTRFRCANTIIYIQGIPGSYGYRSLEMIYQIKDIQAPTDIPVKDHIKYLTKIQFRGGEWKKGTFNIYKLSQNLQKHLNCNNTNVFNRILPKNWYMKFFFRLNRLRKIRNLKLGRIFFWYILYMNMAAILIM